MSKMPTSLNQRIKQWAERAILSEGEVDCIIAVMMKILDGKCKMPENEKHIMEQLYRITSPRTGKHLKERYHRFISQHLNRDRTTISEQDILAIYEQRVLAETQISRPVMKTFKARLRTESILPQK